MDEAKTYADFGIPDTAPCLPWWEGVHVGSYVQRGRAVIVHGTSAIGGVRAVSQSVGK